MTDRELMQMALEALEANQPINYCMNNNGEKFPILTEDPFRHARNEKAIDALRARLAKPVQEPWKPATWFPWVCGVCGIGLNGEAVGYVCNRSDCLTRITCGGAT